MPPGQLECASPWIGRRKFTHPSARSLRLRERNNLPRRCPAPTKDRTISHTLYERQLSGTQAMRRDSRRPLLHQEPYRDYLDSAMALVFSRNDIPCRFTCVGSRLRRACRYASHPGRGDRQVRRPGFICGCRYQRTYATHSGRGKSGLRTSAGLRYSRHRRLSPLHASYDRLRKSPDPMAVAHGGERSMSPHKSRIPIRAVFQFFRLGRRLMQGFGQMPTTLNRHDSQREAQSRTSERSSDRRYTGPITKHHDGCTGQRCHCIQVRAQYDRNLRKQDVARHPAADSGQHAKKRRHYCVELVCKRLLGTCYREQGNLLMDRR